MNKRLGMRLPFSWRARAQVTRLEIWLCVGVDVSLVLLSSSDGVQEPVGGGVDDLMQLYMLVEAWA
jgi:hypothetical protein